MFVVWVLVVWVLVAGSWRSPRPRLETVQSEADGVRGQRPCQLPVPGQCASSPGRWLGVEDPGTTRMEIGGAVKKLLLLLVLVALGALVAKKVRDAGAGA